MEKNKADPMGDGDQSLIFDRKKADWIRNMWSTGGDVEECARDGKLSPFAFACMAGDFEKCEEELNQCEGATEKIQELLETRYSSLRFLCDLSRASTPLSVVLTASLRRCCVDGRHGFLGREVAPSTNLGLHPVAAQWSVCA